MSLRANRDQTRLPQIFARVAPAIVLVQLLSFGSSIVLASTLGASTTTDAYYLALSVPVVAYAVLLAAIRLGGIPVLTQTASESSADFDAVSSELVTGTLVVSTAMSILVTLVMVFALPAAAGGSARLTELTQKFMVELIPYAVTGALLGALGAVLAVKRRFAITALVLAFEPILKSVLLLLFSKQLGAQALIIGNLVGNGLAVVVLWLVVSKDGVSLRLAAFYTSPTVRRIFRLSIPLVVSQSVIQLNPLIDRAAAAGLGRGTVTEFELGVRLFTAPATLLAATLVAPLAATWSTRFAEDGWGAVTKSFSRVIAALVIVVPPIIVTGFVLRDEIVRVAYSSHAFTPEAVQHTADVLGVLLIGLLAQVIVVPVSTLFIVRGNTVFPMKVGIANCVINALLDVALRGPLGVTGIALSTTVTLSVLCAIYVWQAQVRWGPLGLGSALRKPATVSAVSCAAIAFWALGSSQVATSGSRWVELAAICGIGAVGVAVHFGAVTLTRAWPGTARRAGSRARWIGATPG